MLANIILIFSKYKKVSMWYYQLYNLTIQTTIEFPNLQTCSTSTIASSDIQIKLGKVAPLFDVIHYIKEWDELSYTVGLVDGKLTTLINYKEVARYLIQDGQSITIQKMPFGTVVDMESYLISLALSSLLFQRGYFLLHGATVVKNGQAYIILGSSGSGKTSTTVGLMKSGYSILAEDITVLKYIDGIPYIIPGVPYVKLLRDVADRENFDWDTLNLLYSDDEKRAYLLDKEYEVAPTPLRKIYSLDATQVETLTLNEITDTEDKFATIAMNIHYPYFFEGYDIEEYYTNMAYQLLDDISFRKLERPIGKNTLNEMLDLLEKDFTVLKKQSANLKL